MADGEGTLPPRHPSNVASGRLSTEAMEGGDLGAIRSGVLVVDQDRWPQLGYIGALCVSSVIPPKVWVDER